MSNARYVQINVGRNVSGTPMTQDRWDMFAYDVAAALVISARATDYSPFGRHVGTGSWVNPDGTVEHEESMYISSFGDFDAHALRIELKKLAEKYEQDAIALIIGSELIEA